MFYQVTILNRKGDIVIQTLFRTFLEISNYLKCTQIIEQVTNFALRAPSVSTLNLLYRGRYALTRKPLTYQDIIFIDDYRPPQGTPMLQFQTESGLPGAAKRFTNKTNKTDRSGIVYDNYLTNNPLTLSGFAGPTLPTIREVEGDLISL